MTIFKRDKERGGGIVVTMPTTNDVVAVKNRPAPKGKPIWTPSDCVACLPDRQAPSRHSQDYASSSRLASDPNLDFQNSYYLCVNQ